MSRVPGNILDRLLPQTNRHRRSGILRHCANARVPVVIEWSFVFSPAEKAIGNKDSSSRAQQPSEVREPVPAREMAGTVDGHGGVETAFARYSQRIAQECPYPRRNSGLRGESRHPVHVGRDTGHGGKTGVKILRPKNCAAAKTATDIKDLSAQIRRRIPDSGGVME